MAVTTELSPLHRTVDEPRQIVTTGRARYGDIPAVKRLLGDIERIDLDASEPDDRTPPAAASIPEASEIHILDDQPLDPARRPDAGDEGLGGPNGGPGR
jgi:hypothetical protein